MSTDWTTETKGTGEYAEVKGINLYYETHGAGRPMIRCTAGSARARWSGRSFRRWRSTTRSSRWTSRGTVAWPTSVGRSTFASWPTIPITPRIRARRTSHA